LLSVDSVHTYYGESHILQGISLEIAAGELVCLFGRNGAGKTTTIRSIIGLTRPRSGAVRLHGRDVTGMPPERIARLGVGLVPQGHRIFRDLSVQENLQFAARPKRGPWDVARAYRTFPRLEERKHNRGDHLSGGEQQMLALARALMLAPRILLVDEPSVGLAPLLVARTIDAIKQLKDHYQLTVLMAEQNFTQAIRIADRGYVIVHGKIAFEGRSADELNNNDLIRQFYLGM
jgi:branched-chain amino acid transport system ATP-binding protein